MLPNSVQNVLFIHLLFRKKKDLQAVFDCLDFEQHTLDFTLELWDTQGCL